MNPNPVANPSGLPAAPTARDPNHPSDDSCSNTPPPTQKAFDQNNPPPFQPAPSFAEFLVRSGDSRPPAPLQPEEAILDTEIQEIKAEEFLQSITTANNAANIVLNLQLPRSCKRLAKDLATLLCASKRAFEETGVMPVEEAICIRRPPKPKSSSSSRSSAHQNPPRKHGKRDPDHSGYTSKSSTPDTDRPTLSSPGTTNMHGVPTITVTGPLPEPSGGPEPASHNCPDPIEMQPASAPGSTASFAAGTSSTDQITPSNKSPAVHNDTNKHQSQPASDLQDPAPPGHPQTSTSGNAPSPYSCLITYEEKLSRFTRNSMVQNPTGTNIKLPGNPSLRWLRHVLARCRQYPQPTARSALSAQPVPMPIGSNLLVGLFLSPAQNEQWNCPDIIDFPLLSTFRNADNALPPCSFIPTATKTSHPESTLVRFLHQFLHLPPVVYTKWAKLVAASVDIMAENLFQPAPVTLNNANDQLKQGVQVLQYLDKQKSCSSSFDNTTADEVNSNNNAEDPTLLRSHSLDVLHEFWNVIIDVIMAYVILHTHANSEPPMSQAKKKSNQRALQTRSASQTQKTLATPDTASNITQGPPDAHLQLRTYSKKQNLQPLVYFVFGGVRGLFIASRNYRVAGITECMSFIQAILLISQASTTVRNPKESIWRNLSTLLVKLLSPIFHSTNRILANIHIPSRHAIAEAITTDFLHHWETSNPPVPFLLPRSTQQPELIQR
ncbi:hypothetical protein PtB15_12B351 [Puccinia triticina]|nr:hypothetical protein PtB15_12B351 [Puccinia triticina]